MGHLLILGATLFWAAENTYAKHVLKEVSGTVVAFGRMFFGSVFIFAFLLITGKTSIIPTMTSVQFSWIGITSVFLLLYVFTFYNGLKHIKVTTAAAILTLSAPLTVLLQWIVQGAAVTSFQAVGMLLLVAGVR